MQIIATTHTTTATTSATAASPKRIYKNRRIIKVKEKKENLRATPAKNEAKMRQSFN